MGARDSHSPLKRWASAFGRLILHSICTAAANAPVLIHAPSSAHVTIEDAELVEVVGGQNDLCGVEYCTGVRVGAAHEIGIHVPARNEVEDEAQVILRLEGKAQRNDKGMLDRGERLLFAEDGMSLILGNQDPLVDHLERI
eukprot:scaffold155737_cov27-Tisochrysis_lutea.AAC.3